MKARLYNPGGDSCSIVIEKAANGWVVSVPTANKVPRMIGAQFEEIEEDVSVIGVDADPGTYVFTEFVEVLAFLDKTFNEGK